MAVLREVDRYKGNEFTFPDFEGTPRKDKKTPAYNLKVLEAIFSKYVKNKTQITTSETTFFDILRAYAKGKQDPNMYKSFYGNQGGSGLDVSSDTDTDILANRDYHRKGWMNVMWDEIVSFVPNVINTIKGHFVDKDQDIRASVIDMDSGAEEEMEANKLWAYAKFPELINKLKATAGIPIAPPEYVPSSYQELEDIKNEGGFKPWYAKEHEKLLLHTERISNWDRSLKDKAESDLVTIGYTFAYPYYDKETCKVKWRYADPKDVVCQYSRHTDFNDIDWGGVFDVVPFSEIRQKRNMIYDKDGKQLTDEGLKKIAELHYGYSGNPTENEWKRFGRTIDQSVDKYDDFRVLTLKGFWIDVDYDDKLEYTKKNGNKRYYPLTEDVKALGKREKIKRVRRRVLYSGIWIVGSPYIYEFGLFPNQPRMPYNKPLMPLIGAHLEEKSIVHRLVPIANGFQNAWLKFENGIAKAAQGGYAVDLSRMANITDGGKKYNFMKIIKMWRENNIFFYKSGTNGLNVGGTPVPINKVEGNFSELVTESIVIMDNMIKKIEELTGLPPIVLGSTPDPNAPVGTSELSANASIMALRPVINAMFSLKEGLAKVSSPMIDMVLKNDEQGRQSYAKVIGRDAVDFLAKAKDSGYRYGITMEARPTNQAKSDILNIANTSYEKYLKTGIGLNGGQRMWVYQRLDEGSNIDEVRYRMQYWERISEERAQQMSERKITLQNQGLEKIEVTKENEKRKTAAMQDQLDGKKTSRDTQAKIIEREHDSQKKKEEIAVQKGFERAEQDNKK